MMKAGSPRIARIKKQLDEHGRVIDSPKIGRPFKVTNAVVNFIKDETIKNTIIPNIFLIKIFLLKNIQYFSFNFFILRRPISRACSIT